MLWSNRASLPPRDPTEEAGCYWGVSELGKEDRIKGMNAAWKISTVPLPPWLGAAGLWEGVNLRCGSALGA